MDTGAPSFPIVHQHTLPNRSSLLIYQAYRLFVTVTGSDLSRVPQTSQGSIMDLAVLTGYRGWDTAEACTENSSP
ncbi:hypothetical protein BaRGS_00039951 [Batillaria attramentaria]|uniref:Uncharacterized protein n=1 Tax=Batillaria attramentaria TaxID=370345 RepID=A0ABD0J2C0_9CAEN